MIGLVSGSLDDTTMAAIPKEEGRMVHVGDAALSEHKEVQRTTCYRV